MHQQTVSTGTATIEPAAPQIAGSFAQVTLTYLAAHPIDDTGYLKIAFRYASDFGTPQLGEPHAPNYVSVSTTANCRLDARWDPKGHTRPWGKCLIIKVMSGYVGAGDHIRIVFGDQSQGSPGWQLPTFCEDTLEFKVLVDPIATHQFKEVLPAPTLRIVPGAPARAVAIAPSQVVAGESFTWHLKLEDRWGNPTALPSPQTHPGFPEPGTQRLTGQDSATGLGAETNPIRVIAGPAAARPCWADLHGQSEETIGTNTIDQYFTFARDCALLDAAAHQGNDFQVTDAFWEQVNDTTRRFQQAGRFVTFPGYEWSGNTPLGGDRNVYYGSEGGPIFRSCFDLLPGQTSAWPQAATADELFSLLRGQAEETPARRPFTYAHVGGRYADVHMHDDAIELAVEVHSAWGTFEWLVEDALRLGYRIGIVANSDGHKGRPGASYPGASRFGSLGGLTCILAESLDRQPVLDALIARRCYATTGHRPCLELDLTTADGRRLAIGEIAEGPAGPARLRLNYAGTGEVEAVHVRNGLETVSTWRPPVAAPRGRRVKIVWQGAEVRGRARQVTWDGMLELTGNAIESVAPINFWNADRQPRLHGDSRVNWQAITTGGICGLVLTLRDDAAGVLQVSTDQGDLSCDLAELGSEPSVWSFGGIGKAIAISRLPDDLPRDVQFELELPDWRPGDNPIYVRIDQVDGHMTWTSPIYVVP